jgi:hypothetical protein
MWFLDLQSTTIINYFDSLSRVPLLINDAIVPTYVANIYQFSTGQSMTANLGTIFNFSNSQTFESFSVLIRFKLVTPSISLTNQIVKLSGYHEIFLRVAPVSNNLIVAYSNTNNGVTEIPTGKSVVLNQSYDIVFGLFKNKIHPEYSYLTLQSSADTDNHLKKYRINSKTS